MLRDPRQVTSDIGPSGGQSVTGVHLLFEWWLHISAPSMSRMRNSESKRSQARPISERKLAVWPEHLNW